jgi:hypothetical protein
MKRPSTSVLGLFNYLSNVSPVQWLEVMEDVFGRQASPTMPGPIKQG